MELVGIGIDVTDVARMEEVLLRTPRLAERVFSSQERAYCDAQARPAEHYAARWAAREAVAKALGTGFADGVGYADITVTRREGGQPAVCLSGGAARGAEGLGVTCSVVSLSHTSTLAVAEAAALAE